MCPLKGASGINKACTYANQFYSQGNVGVGSGGVEEVRRTLHFLTVTLDYDYIIQTLGGRYATRLRRPTSKGLPRVGSARSTRC